MRIIFSVIFGLFLVCGCTEIPKGPGARLVPPEGSTWESRARDVDECVAKARDGYRRALPVEDRERAVLQGRSTVKFFREGLPVVDREGIPAMWDSPLIPPGGYAPKGISDRYIMYLIARGYQWPSIYEPAAPAGQTAR
jgi:hypothetical protein